MEEGSVGLTPFPRWLLVEEKYYTWRNILKHFNDSFPLDFIYFSNFDNVSNDKLLYYVKLFCVVLPPTPPPIDQFHYENNTKEGSGSLNGRWSNIYGGFASNMEEEFRTHKFSRILHSGQSQAVWAYPWFTRYVDSWNGKWKMKRIIVCLRYLAPPLFWKASNREGE